MLSSHKQILLYIFVMLKCHYNIYYNSLLSKINISSLHFTMSFTAYKCYDCHLRVTSLLLEYKTLLSTSLSVSYFFTIIAQPESDMHQSSVQNSAIYIFQKNELLTHAHQPHLYNAQGRISFNIEEIKSRKEKNFHFVHLPSSSKKSPLFTDIQNFSYVH